MLKSIAGIVAFTLGLAAAPASAAQGLAGAYYATASGPGNLANAESLIAGATPDATFIATTLCYPGCGASGDDNETLASFLGADAASLSANSISNLSNHVITLTGSIDIATAGTYTFSIGSDDGSSLTIDEIATLNDNDHSFTSVSQDYTLSAGLHSIRIVQFEDGGITGLTLLENNDTVPVASLSTLTAAVPESASWAMMIAGVGAIGGMLRRAYRRSEETFTARVRAIAQA